MKGIFYGIGVGPGDPELMTLKAIRIIRECEIVAVAVSHPEFRSAVYEAKGETSAYPEILEACAAYQIALSAVPEICGKARLLLPMPMRKEKEILSRIHDSNAEMAAGYLRDGNSVAYLTLGDPSIYSTWLYLQSRLSGQGFDTRMIPGIPSFCAAAARLNTGLAENMEELHILPASYQIEEGLALPGTKVLMKAGRKMPDVKRAVARRGLQARMVENCGMETERVYQNVEEIPDAAGYFSLLIVKEGRT